MSPRRQRPLFQRGLGFFGAITASLSHEINNVLAIVNELAGLIDDFLEAEEQGQPPDPAGLKKAVEKIAQRIRGSKQIVHPLNRFAHSVDHPRSRLDAGDAAAEVCLLCQRFAKLRRIDLSCDPPEQSLFLEGSLFDLQHVLFRCIEIALGMSEQGARVTVAPRAFEDGVRFTISGPIPIAEVTEELASSLSFLSLLTEHLGGRIETSLEPASELSLVLYLPLALQPLLIGQPETP